MSEKLPVNNFKGIEHDSHFNKDFIKNYNEKSDKGYFLKVDVQYLGKLHQFHNDLSFIPERTKIEKFEKLVANLYDNAIYVIQIRNLKQALNQGIILKKVHRVIKFNQNAWLKPYIDMSTNLRKKANNYFEKDFF